MQKQCQQLVLNHVTNLMLTKCRLIGNPVVALGMIRFPNCGGILGLSHAAFMPFGSSKFAEGD